MQPTVLLNPRPPIAVKLIQCFVFLLANISLCHEAAFIGFILDKSGSIGERDFKKGKQFIKNIASTFRTGPRNSSFALITFSDAARVQAQFGDHSDLRSFEAKLDALSQAKGGTRIDKALEVAAYSLFGSLGSASLTLSKVLVIVTDGSQPPASDAVSLKEAVLPLRKLGVRVLVVGVTDSIHIAELLTLVERDQDVFWAKDFDDLLRKSCEIAEATCKLSAKGSSPRGGFFKHSSFNPQLLCQGKTRFLIAFSFLGFSKKNRLMKRSFLFSYWSGE